MAVLSRLILIEKLIDLPLEGRGGGDSLVGRAREFSSGG